MKARLEYSKVVPEAFKAMVGLEAVIHSTRVEESLLDLIKLRASQINGCAYCIDMHSKGARARGESEQRLFALDAWRETPFYSDRERAALAWTEALTLVSKSHVPDDVYEEVQTQFSERELVGLTLAVVAINGWNRLEISFRNVPESYRTGGQPRVAEKA